MHAQTRVPAGGIPGDPGVQRTRKFEQRWVNGDRSRTAAVPHTAVQFGYVENEGLGLVPQVGLEPSLSVNRRMVCGLTGGHPRSSEPQSCSALDVCRLCAEEGSKALGIAKLLTPRHFRANAHRDRETRFSPPTLRFSKPDCGRMQGKRFGTYRSHAAAWQAGAQFPRH